LKRLFTLLPDRPTLLTEWEGLVGTYQCIGKVAHDARLVAAMRTHGVTHLLTFNGADFARYPGLTVLDPAIVTQPPSTTP
jgi:predicted nucleic acid-binding protein